jgi:hypothetical protein
MPSSHPLKVADALRKHNIGKIDDARITPGNWMDQLGEKQGTFNKPAALLSLLPLPGLGHQLGSPEEKSELAESAWNSSEDPGRGWLTEAFITR